MTVRLGADGITHLEGVCGIEDAEPLLRYLLAAPEPRVDWHQCEGAHTAIVQLLLNVRPAIDGAPLGDFLTQHITPLVNPQSAGETALFKA